MAKKPKSISVNTPFTTFYDLNQDAKSYVFGPKFISEGASTLTGIDTADAVTGTTIKFKGLINLTGAPATGSVLGMDIDVSKDSSITLTKKGAVTATNTGVDAHASDGILSIVNNGTIIGTKDYGILGVNDSGAQGSLVILNNKTISGGQAGISLHEDGASITNGVNGVITGTNATGTLGIGLLIDDNDIYKDFITGEGLTTIINKGTIAGAGSGDSIQVRDVTVNLDNSGFLTGGVTLHNGNDVLINSGTITGGVVAGLGNDVIKSTGIITGDVFLGDGNDRFEGTLATGMSVSGGNGNDTFVFGATIGTIIELANQGTSDMVVAAANIDLTNLIEIENAGVSGTGNLDILGSMNNNVLYGNAGSNVINGAGGFDSLYGNAGDDTLIGGASSDALIGGAGADIFKFAVGDSSFALFDTIRDFVSGVDKLSLGVAGSAANFHMATAAAVNNIAFANQQANAALLALSMSDPTGTRHYALEQFGTDSYLYIDNDHNGTADEKIVLQNVDLAHFAVTDIVM